MKKILLLLFVLNFTLVSCFKDEDDTGLLSGVYVEVTPVPGRTQLNFISGDRLIKIEEGSDVQDEFIYQIEEEYILLTPASEDAPTTELEFEYLDSFRFEIGSLYPSIPENVAENMVFAKQ